MAGGSVLRSTDPMALYCKLLHYYIDLSTIIFLWKFISIQEYFFIYKTLDTVLGWWESDIVLLGGIKVCLFVS